MRPSQTTVALLRGINVGGTKPVPMVDLRAVLAGLGYTDIESYIQSGNLVFTDPAPGDAANRIRRAIRDRFEMDVTVITRTQPDLESIFRFCPFDAATIPGNLLHVVFLAEVPDPEATEQLDPDRSPPDRFVVAGREIFVHFPNGSGRSKLTIDYFERTLRTPATMRNWNTVARIREMARSRT